MAHYKRGVPARYTFSQHSKALAQAEQAFLLRARGAAEEEYAARLHEVLPFHGHNVTLGRYHLPSAHRLPLHVLEGEDCLAYILKGVDKAS